MVWCHAGNHGLGVWGSAKGFRARSGCGWDVLLSGSKGQVLRLGSRGACCRQLGGWVSRGMRLPPPPAQTPACPRAPLYPTHGAPLCPLCPPVLAGRRVWWQEGDHEDGCSLRTHVPGWHAVGQPAGHDCRCVCVGGGRGGQAGMLSGNPLAMTAGGVWGVWGGRATQMCGNLTM